MDFNKADAPFVINCNKCGNHIDSDKSDWLEVNKRWGYYSDFDNCVHSFYICKSCYRKFISDFKIRL